MIFIYILFYNYTSGVIFLVVNGDIFLYCDNFLYGDIFLSLKGDIGGTLKDDYYTKILYGEFGVVF